MAVDTIWDFSASGTVCGVPFDIGMGYKQIDPDVAGKAPGISLIEGWFSQLQSPWLTIRPSITNQLSFDCAVAIGDGIITTVFLNDAQGTSAIAPLPATHCLKVVCPPDTPNTTFEAGRFFLPGFTIDGLDGNAWSVLERANLELFMTSLKLVDSENLTAGQGRFALMPHANFRDGVGGIANVFADNPFYGFFVHRLASRRVDACAAFTSGNLSGTGTEITVPPPAP